MALENWVPFGDASTETDWGMREKGGFRQSETSLAQLQENTQPPPPPNTHFSSVTDALNVPPSMALSVSEWVFSLYLL